MGKCCIVNCNSNYKNNNEKYVKFAAPKNVDLRKKWAMAISRKDYVITDNTYVCEKHFSEHDIIRFWQSGSESTLLVKIPYQKPKLRENAIPSIFPGPAYLFKQITRKSPTEQQNTFNNKNKYPANIFNDLAITKNENLYDKLNILATEVDHSSIIEKSISVAKTGEVTFGVLGKKIDPQKLNITPAITINDFLTNINKFEKINVCHGGPSLTNFPKAPFSLCVVNTLGRLQHWNCNLIVKEKVTSCIKCRRLDNMLRIIRLFPNYYENYWENQKPLFLDNKGLLSISIGAELLVENMGSLQKLKTMKSFPIPRPYRLFRLTIMGGDGKPLYRSRHAPFCALVPSPSRFRPRHCYPTADALKSKGYGKRGDKCPLFNKSGCR
ncbi:Zinc finger, C2CH-type, partial [Cinara cedri]